MTNFRLVQANYYARRYDEAVRAGRIAIELTPDSPYTYFYLALSLAALGSNEEAWGMAIMGRKLAGGMPLGEGYFGYIGGALGHTSRPARLSRSWRLGPKKAMSLVCPLFGLISVWGKRQRSYTGWRQLWLNGIHS
jgi:hypothetical protein